MKIYLFAFVLVLGVVGCENAIKNEIKPVLIASNEEVTKPFGNENLVVNSKEDLLGYWVYDFQDYDENKFYGKFIFSFSKLNKDKIYGKLFINEQQIPVVMDLSEDGQKITISYQSSFQKIPFKNIVFDIIKGTKQLEGQVIVLEYEENTENYKIEMKKKNFVYNIDGLVERMYVDDNKTGIGYRDYDLVVEEIIEIDSIQEKSIKEKKQEIKVKTAPTPSRVEREGYFATTKDIFKINPSKEVLENEVVENLSKADLYILNKLIYAKHGKIFSEKKLSQYFLDHSWYLPVSNNVNSELTEIEKKNIDLLERYERNAKEYYQVFGR